MGFCAGVRRAVNYAESALEKNKTGQVYTLGPLIHNPVALADFERRGIKILSEENISAVKKEDTVVIRAHGVKPEVYQALISSGAEVLNGTCPIVQSNQKKCAEYASKGYTIFFTGDTHHGEVIGIEGAARKGAEDSGLKLNFFLVKDKNESEEVIQILKAGNNSDVTSSPVVLLSQTTFSISVFDEIEQVLSRHYSNLEVLKTICPATHERQNSLVELCKKVDGVIVIGGKSSANTNRLLATALKLCRYAVLIESAEEIPDIFFTFGTVGLTAGASTPDKVIEEVESKLCNGYN